MSTESYLVRRGIYQSLHLEVGAKDNAELSRQRHGTDGEITRPGSVEKPTQDEVITKDQPVINLE
jgi:hypothetical protein